LALTPTLYTFDIALSDVDRGVYENLTFRVACHPSETHDFLLARVLGYCLEYAPGIEFGNDLSNNELPAVAVRDLTGALTLWLDVGAPDADRLHKASKRVARVVVYTHRDPVPLLRQLNRTRIHRSEELRIFALDRPLLLELTRVLDRRNRWEIAVSDRTLFVTVGKTTLSGTVTEHRLGGDGRTE
jgi:uncharacterized protein YaeQ